jgi:hypothetical protein
VTLRASHRLLPSPPSSALQCAPSRGGQHCCSRGSNPVAPAIRGVAKLCRGVPIRGLVGVPRWYECCRGIVCLVLSKSILPYPRHHPTCVHPPTSATLPHPPSPGATRHILSPWRVGFLHSPGRELACRRHQPSCVHFTHQRTTAATTLLPCRREPMLLPSPRRVGYSASVWQRTCSQALKPRLG